MDELELQQVRIDDAFWTPRLEMNATRAIFHQWEQLERTGCIDNFRLVAGDLDEGFREGWFFADSDAYKWLDAACRIQVHHPSAKLGDIIDGLVDLLARAQDPDGYLYTYNQIHSPGQRWVNLQIEHELYCHGHLIEACISHQKMQRALGPLSRPACDEQPDKALAIACKAAGLLVRDLTGMGPEYTDGHEEIELALIKLWRLTNRQEYLDLAQQLIDRRGRIRRFWKLILQQNKSTAARRALVQERRRAYLAAHPEHAAFQLPPGNVAMRTRFGRLRYRFSALSGRLLQQHLPVRQIRAPVGHAVRFTYLETAAAMLCRIREDPQLQAALEAAWERMVRKRMYVTGGLGALPEIEGFGRDYELDPMAAYAETCAALGCLFWNWEMTLLTREARYADLFEWQLYNATSVGMGCDGTTYLYNNPLGCRGGIERRAWFEVPCCPSNLSRTWGALRRYLFSVEGDGLWIHQYLGSQAELEVGLPVRMEVQSGLPWDGRIRLHIEPEKPTEFTCHLRIPSWTRGYHLRLNGHAWEPLPLPPDRQTPVSTACGYAPHAAFYVPIHRTWSPGDVVELDLPMPIVIRRPHWRVWGGHRTAALTRGPLVYCLESVDNPEVDLFRARVDLASLRPDVPPEGAIGAHPYPLWPTIHGRSETAPAGAVLRGQTVDGQPLIFIPYSAWANRGPSQMNVMVRL